MQMIPTHNTKCPMTWSGKNLVNNKTLKLLSPFALGSIPLTNRIVMAPMTRSRSLQPGNIPGPMNALYYAQRASAGLIITEGAQISPQGQGYPWTPGIHTLAQQEGWSKIAAAVHARGGKIFMQLWHVGRISHPLIQPDGKAPVAPSAITPNGEVFVIDRTGQPALLPFEQPRALTTEEIAGIIESYSKAAYRAKEAGMDGVEIHAANGYLLDQFLCSGTNHRTDAYGGTPEHRIRLLLEVIDAVCEVFEAEHVGVRISPFGTFNDMNEDQPETVFGLLAKQLCEKNLAYLHVVDPSTLGSTEDLRLRGTQLITTIRNDYHGRLILCGDYSTERAERALCAGNADLIGFGRPFISNPDLPERMRESAILATPDESTFYSGGPHGYVDYPTLRQERGLHPASDLTPFID